MIDLDNDIGNELPHYESSAVAAILVVAKMGQRGFAMHVVQWPDYENWEASFVKDGKVFATVRLGSFSTAICAAALLAVRNETPPSVS